jgi:hypothetical protein
MSVLAQPRVELGTFALLMSKPYKTMKMVEYKNDTLTTASLGFSELYDRHITI